MFDFNSDGHIDSGEQWTGYQMFTDKAPKAGRNRLDGWEKVIITLLIWQVISLIFGGGR